MQIISIVILLESPGLKAAVAHEGSVEPTVPLIREANRRDLPTRLFRDVPEYIATGDVSIIITQIVDFSVPPFLEPLVTDAILANECDAKMKSDEDLMSLYEYIVPTVSADGTCSNVHHMAKRPFNLATDVYGLTFTVEVLRNHAMTRRLLRLNEVVSYLYELTHADWIGVYRCVEADGVVALVKEAYRGEPSRAVFPVTEQFSKKSTNSWVGLTGQYRVINDTVVRDEGVAYYECSGLVRSELCVPILRKCSVDGDDCLFHVIGIIDLESWNVKHFSESMIVNVLRVALSLGEHNLGL